MTEISDVVPEPEGAKHEPTEAPEYRDDGDAPEAPSPDHNGDESADDERAER